EGLAIRIDDGLNRLSCGWCVGMDEEQHLRLLPVDAAGRRAPLARRLPHGEAVRETFGHLVAQEQLPLQLIHGRPFLPRQTEIKRGTNLRLRRDAAVHDDTQFLREGRRLPAPTDDDTGDKDRDDHHSNQHSHPHRTTLLVTATQTITEPQKHSGPVSARPPGRCLTSSSDYWAIVNVRLVSSSVRDFSTWTPAVSGMSRRVPLALASSTVIVHFTTTGFVLLSTTNAPA